MSMPGHKRRWLKFAFTAFCGLSAALGASVLVELTDDSRSPASAGEVDDAFVDELVSDLRSHVGDGTRLVIEEREGTPAHPGKNIWVYGTGIRNKLGLITGGKSIFDRNQAFKAAYNQGFRPKSQAARSLATVGLHLDAINHRKAEFSYSQRVIIVFDPSDPESKQFIEEIKTLFADLS